MDVVADAALLRALAAEDLAALPARRVHGASARCAPAIHKGGVRAGGVQGAASQRRVRFHPLWVGEASFEAGVKPGTEVAIVLDQPSAIWGRGAHV